MNPKNSSQNFYAKICKNPCIFVLFVVKLYIQSKKIEYRSEKNRKNLSEVLFMGLMMNYNIDK